MQDYWQKQAADKPQFPDLLWSRPETLTGRGKLLIIGGNAFGFAAPAEAAAAAEKAGIGVSRILLPQPVAKLLPKSVMEVEFAPGTPSGSFARGSLAEICDLAAWADGVLLAGDFGRNSETAIMLEQLIQKYTGQLTITQDAADYFIKSPAPLLNRPETLLVISIAQLQKLATAARFTTAIKYEMDFIRLIEALHEFTQQHQIALMTKHHSTMFVALQGQVSTSRLDQDPKVWRVKAAAAASVWWLQNPSKTFEALTSSILDA